MASVDITFEEVEFKGELATVEAEIEFSVSPIVRGCHTQWNGDPGWPDEGGEVEVSDLHIVSAVIGDDERPATTEELAELEKIVEATCQDHISSTVDDAAASDR